MIVIGCDPGSRRFGLAVLEDREGTIRMLHSETISLLHADLQQRMHTLWHKLEAILPRFPLDASALEEGFLGVNARSQNVLAQVRGLVMASMIHHSIPLTLYSPRTVKQAVSGNGNAAKDQVQRVMERLLNLAGGVYGEDETDAMAVAYCHLLSRPRGRASGARRLMPGRRS